MTIQNETIHALDSLVRFYGHRAFSPVWICDEGLLPHAEAFVQVIGQAEREGMRSVTYHLATIQGLLAELRLDDSQRRRSQSIHSWVDLELLLTDAFFSYGTHVLTGQIAPQDIKEVWVAHRPAVDLATILQHALDTNRVTDVLRHLRPTHAGYTRLLRALAMYRDLSKKGGWPVIPDGPTLRMGDRGPRVAALRTRLRLTADLETTSGPIDDVFDAGLERGVQRFQERHGLTTDGVVGDATLTALNTPAAARARQIELNMERWRWLPEQLEDRYILVNIPSFALDVIENGRSVLTMPVVVGRPERQTPFFSADMTYLVLSPHWHVPATIAIQDKLPLIRRDPGYVVRQNFKLFRDGEGGVSRVDPLSVDWSAVSARNFPYKLRQDPGPRNALGGVKFMFPNRYHVYLHDTPSRELFTKTERAFSSGCIRIEKPIQLAEYLLQDDPQWSRQKILTTIGRGVEEVVQLPTSIPVHLLYWTAWATEDGAVHFRKDIYERDKVLDKVLRESFPERGGNAQVEMVLNHQ